MRLPKFQTVDTLKTSRFFSPGVLAAARRSVAVGSIACMLFGSAAYAAPAEPVEPREVRMWLMRIHNAASQRNFQGTFVVSSAGGVSSARISHFHVGSDQFEHIEPLDGQARHVLRHNSLVHTLWPRARVALVEQRDVLNSFPSLLLDGDDRIGEFYEIQPQRTERVAGHDATLLILKPRDEFRFGYRLWADRDTGLLLRAEVLNERGEVIEVSAFSDVAIGVRSQPELILQPMRKLDGYRIVKPRLTPTKLEAEGWSVKQSVAGFRQLNCIRRPLEMLLNPDTDLRPAQTVQSVFSDGITYVSVFIEPYDEQRHLQPMLSASGATQTLVSRRGDHWFTIVGDVPAVTLRAFLAAFERRK